jgi:hypothetical protein
LGVQAHRAKAAYEQIDLTTRLENGSIQPPLPPQSENPHWGDLLEAQTPMPGWIAAGPVVVMKSQLGVVPPLDLMGGARFARDAW